MSFLIQKGSELFCTKNSCDDTCLDRPRCKIISELKLVSNQNKDSDIVKYSTKEGSDISFSQEEIELKNKILIKDKDSYSKLRGTGKQHGLATVYGQGAYSLAQKLGIAQESSQKILDTFFGALPDVQQYILFQEVGVKKNGFTTNMFGRILNLQKWAFSTGGPGPFKDERERNKQIMKDKGYAVRMGLNFPIQSTSAEALKISMLRIDALIQENSWNPLYGSTPPQKLNPEDRKSFICTTAMSIHDELDFLIDYQKIDEVIPIVYTTLQIKDVVKSLGVDFELEQDVEFDEWGSFTANSRYHNSRIHLLNLLREKGAQVPSPDSEEEKKQSNLKVAVFDINQISDNFLNYVNSLDSSKLENTFLLGVQTSEGVFFLSNKGVTSEVLQVLEKAGGKYRLIEIKTGG